MKIALKICNRTITILLHIFYYSDFISCFLKIVRNKSLTKGPTKNICRKSAAGKHFTASVIHCTNHSVLKPLCMKTAISVIVGTIRQTVKHWMARIIKIFLSFTGLTILKANFCASFSYYKKYQQKHYDILNPHFF